MYAEGKLKNRICLILIGFVLAAGILATAIEAQSMPSTMQMVTGEQSVEQASLEVIHLLNPEEVALNSARNMVASGIMRITQGRNNLPVHLLQFLLVVLPTFLTFFYLLVASFLLCSAQGRSVIIGYIHNKDGQKDRLHN